MLPDWPFILTALIAFLAGSLPTGLLVARLFKVDIRAVGSGNIGATNVFRVLGKGPGLFVLAVDALKGVVAVLGVPVLIAQWFLAKGIKPPDSWVWLPILGGLCAVLGHNYTPWLKFRGGKGIATSAGVLASLLPIAFGIALITFLVLLAFTSYVSLASLAAALILPFAAWLTQKDPRLVWLAAVLAALAFYKHRSNIQRLIAGKENRIGHRKPPES